MLLVRLRSQAPVERLDGYQHIGGDLSDKKSIESALQTAHPTHVLHLGALQTPDCRDDPIRGLDVNVSCSGSPLSAAKPPIPPIVAIPVGVLAKSTAF